MYKLYQCHDHWDYEEDTQKNSRWTSYLRVPLRNSDRIRPSIISRCVSSSFLFGMSTLSWIRMSCICLVSFNKHRVLHNSVHRSSETGGRKIGNLRVRVRRELNDSSSGSAFGFATEDSISIMAMMNVSPHDPNLGNALMMKWLTVGKAVRDSLHSEAGTSNRKYVRNFTMMQYSPRHTMVWCRVEDEIFGNAAIDTEFECLQIIEVVYHPLIIKSRELIEGDGVKWECVEGRWRPKSYEGR